MLEGKLMQDTATWANPKKLKIQPSERRMRLNMGPQHPSTHGVLQVILDLEGEVIVKCDPVPGYLHRGTEKLAENKHYNQIIPLTDRLDYLSALSIITWRLCMAVEKLLGLELPPNAPNGCG